MGKKKRMLSRHYMDLIPRPSLEVHRNMITCTEEVTLEIVNYYINLVLGIWIGDCRLSNTLYDL